MLHKSFTYSLLAIAYYEHHLVAYDFNFRKKHYVYQNVTEGFKSSHQEVLLQVHFTKSVQIRSEYWKIRTRKIPYLDTFHAVKNFCSSRTVMKTNSTKGASWEFSKIFRTTAFRNTFERPFLSFLLYFIIY